MSTSHVRSALVLSLGGALAACSPSTPATDAGTTGGSDAGANAAECALYCQGMASCVMAGSTCTVSGGEAAFRAECETACLRIAGEMTASQVGEAVACLDCLDGYVDETTCSPAGFDAGMLAGTAVLFGAVNNCGATCMTSGVMTINDRISTEFLTADGGSRLVCADAGM